MISLQPLADIELSVLPHGTRPDSWLPVHYLDRPGGSRPLLHVDQHAGAYDHHETRRRGSRSQPPGGGPAPPGPAASIDPRRILRQTMPRTVLSDYIISLDQLFYSVPYLIGCALFPQLPGESDSLADLLMFSAATLAGKQVLGDTPGFVLSQLAVAICRKVPFDVFTKHLQSPSRAIP